MKYFYFFILLLIIISCSEIETKEKDIETATIELIGDNQLDSIFGDKILNVQTGDIRENNFEGFKNIGISSVLNESRLYEISNIKDGFFLLRQKKNYEKARLFNAILKVNDEKVIDYYILNDFEIKDVSLENEGILILSDDFNNQNIFWKCKREIQIIKLDEEFNELWNYKASYENPLEAVGIDDGYSFTINVITGCHICYSIVNLKLSNEGKYKSVKEIKLNNSDSLTQEQLKNIFKKENG